MTIVRKKLSSPPADEFLTETFSDRGKHEFPNLLSVNHIYINFQSLIVVLKP